MENNRKTYRISFGELLFIEELNANTDFNSFDKICKFIEHLINSNIQPDENSLKGYINQLFADNEIIQNYYNKNKKGNDYFDDVWLAISYSYQEKISDTLEKISNIFSKVSSSVKNITGTLSDSLLPFIESINKITSSFKGFELNTAKIDSLLKKWAKYGWCFTKFSSFSNVDYEPKTIEEADEIQINTYKDEIITSMINEISTYTEYKDDLAEAIICYNEGHFKASLMIIFSIISNILLYMSEFLPKEKNIGKEWASESNAIKIKKISINEKYCNSATSFAIFKSTFLALEEYYKSASNFTLDDCLIVNRNYLLHGMYENKVTKTDLKKLFLCLFNLLEFKSLEKS